MYEAAKDMYDGERWAYLARTKEAREKLNGDCCHDAALHYGVDPEELADYILSVDGYRPDPRIHDDG